MFSRVRARPLSRSSRRKESEVAPAHRTMMFPAVSSKVWASDSLPRARTRRKKQSKSSPSAWRARSHCARRELRGCSFFKYFSVIEMRDDRFFGFGFGVKTGVSAPHSGATRLQSSGDNLITDFNIKTPLTDACNTRVWEKTYNVNLESIKGGKKHLRHSEYTIYTDGSKKQEGTGGGFVVYNLSLIHI